MSHIQKAPTHGLTPWQTVGPFFHYALPWEGGNTLVGSNVSGEKIVLIGQVVDSDGAPIPDAMVEIWQADAGGYYHHPDDPRQAEIKDRDFIGFGRCPTDEEGFYRFETVRPGPVPGLGNSVQAPHIAIGLFGRGLLRRLVTRAYFPDSPLNEADPVLGLIAPERVTTVIASAEAPVDGIPVFRLDLRFQGDRETVFFDV